MSKQPTVPPEVAEFFRGTGAEAHFGWDQVPALLAEIRDELRQKRERDERRAQELRETLARLKLSVERLGDIGRTR